MDFTFTDRSLNKIGIASPSGQAILLDDDADTKSISAASRKFSGTLYWHNDEEEALVRDMGAVGRFIVWTDYRGRSVLTEIMTSDIDPKAHTLDYTSQDAGVDLLDETVGAYTADKAYTIAEYIIRFTSDSGWQIGINEIADLSRTLEWTGEEDTALARIISVATQFDAEIDFSFDFATSPTTKYINVYKQRGTDNGVVLYQDREVDNIAVSTSIEDLMTSIKATGATPEGSDAPITLAGYKWTDPDGRFVLSAGGWLEDTVANQKWSRILTESTSHYINRVKSYTAATQAALLQSVLADLKHYSTPVTTYTVTISVVPEGIDIGDIIRVVDEHRHLDIQARVLELTTSYAGKSATITLGDFVVTDGAIDPGLAALQAQVASIPKTTFPWIRYADDDQGAGMSALPAGKTYMAIVYGKTAVPSDDPADYVDHWALIVGADGKDGAIGTAGTPGLDGKTPYSHIAYAQSVDGTTGFSTTDATNATYLGTCSDFTEADPTDPTAYTWALFKGADGADAIVLTVTSINGNLFKNTGVSTILAVAIAVGATIIDTGAKLFQYYNGTAYLQWQVKKAGETEYTDIAADDPRLSDDGFLLTVGVNDVQNKATFRCDLYE
jgi:phage minor structural protein